METEFSGKRDKRGEWRPQVPIGYAPVFIWPFSVFKVLKWLFGYPGFFFPWGVIYMAIPVLTWLYLTPPLDSMKEFEFGWIAYLLVRNLVMVLAIVGVWHLWLFVKKSQGTDWKYTNKWLARDNPIFLFKNQLFDNLFWTVFSAVPIWTAYEVVTMWLYANQLIPMISIEENPVWFCLLMCLVPLMREIHFYLIHRLIHWGPLYRWAHYLHHNNVDVGPFSGLSMHPIEHVLYWSGVIIHWIIPSHPIHALFHMQHASFTPAQSHSGFERVVFHQGIAVKTGDYFHWLHHKYFECNYGGDGPVPLDKWMGTFNDGTTESIDRMNERFLARAKQKAAAEGNPS